MRLEFELALLDAPGALAPVLQAIADHGGNIETIVHRHERADGDHVPVHVVVEIPEGNTLRLLDALTKKGRLLRVDTEGGPVGTTLLLSGPVFRADFDALFGRAWEEGAEVDSVDARVEGRDGPSAMIVKVSAGSRDVLDRAVRGLVESAAGTGIDCIEAVGGDVDE